MDLSKYIKQLSKDTFIYGLGDAFLKILAVLTMPIYTRIFNPSDYGILSLVNTIVVFLALFLDLGMGSALQRSYFDSTEEKERKKIISTGFWFLLGWGSVFTILVILLAKNISFWILDSPFYTLILITAFLNAFAAIFIGFAKNVMRLRFQPWMFSWIVFLNGILTTVFSLLLVWYYHLGILGFFVGGLTGTLIALIVAWRSISKFISSVFSRLELKKMFSYGIMLVPTAIAYYIFDVSDRFFLARMSTLHELGLYSVAVSISGIMMFFITALSQAWAPFALKLYAEEKDVYKKMFSRVMNYIMIGFSFLSVLIVLFSLEILKILTTPDYYGANKAVGLLVISMLAFASTQVTLVGISIERKTKYMALTAGIAAVINIILNFLFIPKMGMVGAALATAVSYIVLALIYYFISQRLHPISYDLGKIIKIIFLALVIIGVSSLVNLPFGLALLTKFGLIFVFIAGLFVLKILEPGEILFIKRFLRLEKIK